MKNEIYQKNLIRIAALATNDQLIKVFLLQNIGEDEKTAMYEVNNTCWGDDGLYIHDNNYKVTVSLVGEEPKVSHTGFYYIAIEDPTKGTGLGDLGQYVFEVLEVCEMELLKKEPLLNGLEKNGGIYPYDDKYQGVKFEFSLSNTMLRRIQILHSMRREKA